MNINNGFNVLPWYDSLEKQNSKKWYAYGQAWPLLCPQGAILPFQFICDSAITITSTIYAVNAQTGASVNLGVTPTVTKITRADATYYLVKLNSVAVTSLPIGRYNLRMNTSVGYLYSEEITIINNASECIKLEYWNEDTLRFTSGEINFDDNFHFILYINSTIGKPEYEFEEELTKRLGYKFIESQTSNKLYKFAFAAPEYICDALRLVRMCDYIKLTTKYDSYNALSFAYEPKWQEQGDLAAVDVEFDTDCIIQKLESFNRRVKESFYNALLADIDEPVLFSTDTVAQYYTEYTSVSSINGKLIRQLNAISPLELQDSLDSLVLALDNQADSKQEAKKVFLSDILGLVDSVSKLFKGHYDGAGNLLWIEALSHIGVNGGLTMYIDNGKISLPSLYAGLPIDGQTLVWKDGVLMLNPDIELSGGLDEVELNQYLTNNNYAKKSDITTALNGYATTSSLNAVSTKLNDFLTGTDTDTVINKWKELETFLSGLTESDNLATILTGKADKSYIDTNFVTIAGTEDVTGLHNFVNGLKIGGIELIQKNGNAFLKGNLVVEGGIGLIRGNTDKGSLYASNSSIGIHNKVKDTAFYLKDDGGLKYEINGVEHDVLNAGNYSSYALPLSGGQMSGHIYMAGAKANSSTGNTTQIVFGTPSDNHVCITSNRYGIVINRSISDTSNQIALYANADSESFIQSHLRIYGNLFSNIYFNHGGSLAKQSDASMYTWDNHLQINKRAGITYIKTLLDFDLVNETATFNLDSQLRFNSNMYWVSDSTNPYMALVQGGHNWYVQVSQGYMFLGAGATYSLRIDARGNILAPGGTSMYSDQRKKTILNHVELSLKQIADAPLIKHYYNSDQNKTIHVGSIAQYWAELNDWFCKLDNEGYYTMEIQNCALASAISIARHLEKYESKTDKKIRMLKKRITELEDKLERLEGGKYGCN